MAGDATGKPQLPAPGEPASDLQLRHERWIGPDEPNRRGAALAAELDQLLQRQEHWLSPAEARPRLAQPRDHRLGLRCSGGESLRGLANGVRGT